ncbi:hypothetical protein [Candidatus Entotheonella palauensis]|nr:hypothetical protein [Candidatus Entotheonella palauensis]
MSANPKAVVILDSERDGIEQVTDLIHNRPEASWWWTLQVISAQIRVTQC